MVTRGLRPLTRRRRNIAVSLNKSELNPPWHTLGGEVYIRSATCGRHARQAIGVELNDFVESVFRIGCQWISDGSYGVAL